MGAKIRFKKFAIAVAKTSLIRMRRLLGPPHVLNYGLTINVAMLRAFGAKVGKGVRVYPPVSMHNISGGYGNLTIGDNCIVHANSYLDLTGRITLGDGVSLGPGTIVMTHNRYNGNRFLESNLAHTCGIKDVCIGLGTGVKAGTLIVMGVNIGADSVVAGGAVVNRNVPERTFVGGIPARLIRVIGSEDDGGENERYHELHRVDHKLYSDRHDSDSPNDASCADYAG